MNWQGDDNLSTLESVRNEALLGGVASPCDGEVREVMVKIGQAVETDDILLTFKS